MASVDYHAGCGSYVRISLRDLNGPFDLILNEHDHPASAVYPNVKVGTCELAAGHDGLCEMFVDGDGHGEQYTGYWIAWRAGAYDDLTSEYEWITSPDCCVAESPHGYACSRYVDHDGGHVFTVL